MNPTILLGIGIAWAFSLFAVGSWQHDAGQTAERVEWQDKDSRELRAANAKIIDLTEKARAREAEHAKRLAWISEDREKERMNAKAQRDREVAAARAGGLRLQFYPAPDLQAGGCSAGQAGASSSERDGGATGELPREIAANLLDLAHDADDVARQLASAQQVIIEDRRLCGQP